MTCLLGRYVVAMDIEAPAFTLKCMHSVYVCLRMCVSDSVSKAVADGMKRRLRQSDTNMSDIIRHIFDIGYPWPLP